MLTLVLGWDMITGGVESFGGLVFGSLLLATAQHLAAYYIDTKWMDGCGSLYHPYPVFNLEAVGFFRATALLINELGLQKMDSLHLACAIFAKTDYFLTTDDKVIKKACALTDIKISDPIDFIKKVFP